MCTCNKRRAAGSCVFCGVLPRLYTANQTRQAAENPPPHGGGFDYLHRRSTSRWRRRKGDPVPRGITGPPVPGGHGPPGWGSLEPENVKYGRESHGTRTWEWLCWQGPAATANDRSVLSSERAPHIKNPATDRNKIWSWGLQMGDWHQDRLPDWLSVVT
jgi:hypothetical protein